MAEYVASTAENLAALPGASRFEGEGVIVAVQGTTDTLNSKATGPATGITYTVRVLYPTGSYIDFPNWAPTQDRLDCMIYPASVGSEVELWKRADRLYFKVDELPAWKTCT